MALASSVRAAHDADAGLVAARLDAEHEGRVAVHARPDRRGPDAAPDAAARRCGRDLEPHRDRVDVVGLVVAAAHADLDEAQRLVERLRDGVVGAHLEEELARRCAASRLRDERVHEAAAEPDAPRERGDRDGLDVGLAAPGGREQPGVPEQSTLGASASSSTATR